MTVCRRYENELPDVTADALYAALLVDRDWFWSDADRHRRGRIDMLGARRQIVARSFSRLALDLPDLALRLADDYTQERHRRVEPFPGALQTLEELRSAGIPLALLTNGDGRYQRSKITRFALARYFQCIVVESEFGVGKPDPAVFRHALQTLGGLDPRQVWMVGNDLRFDVAPAAALGLTTIWVDVRGRGLNDSAPVRPDRIIRNVIELIG
jgi:putative hydrolase of the HAD superfamily